MSESKIAAIASVLRRCLGIESRQYFPVVHVYEMLHLLGACFEVVEDHLMGEDDARTYPDKNLILLRQSVYDGAAKNEPRARFTMCHELGHLLLHRGVSFARINPDAPPKIFQNSEWQADVFASHLMMPTPLVQGYTSEDAVMADFCVSRKAASYRLAKMRKGS